MKLPIERILLIVVTFVLIVFVFKHCSRPSEEKEAERKAQFEMADAINKADKKEAQARQDSLGKVWADSLAKINVSVKAKDKRIAVLTQQAARQRTTRIDTLLIDNPDLQSYVDTLTEIVQEQKEQIDTLKAALEFTSDLYAQVKNEESIEDRIENNIVQGYQARIAELEKSSRKEKRRGKLAKVLVPIVGVAGLLLGASL